MQMPSKEKVKEGVTIAAIVVAIIALFNYFRSAK